jgi:AbrB family looped-hinge helix DNA binding protein
MESRQIFLYTGKEQKQQIEGSCMTSTVTSKGQVTNPVEARKRLRIRPGTRLQFVVREDGRLEVIPLLESVKSLKGMVPKPARSLSLEEMDDAISKGARR